MKESFLRTFIRIYPFRGYGFAFVILSAANPISPLSNQFRKSRIYPRSRMFGSAPFQVTRGSKAPHWQVSE
jgi:hypothetical protein